MKAEAVSQSSGSDMSPAGQGNSPSRPLCLDQFLKLSSAVDSGGRAKWMIQNGEVKVNGEVETRRRRKLIRGDQVEVNGSTMLPDQYI
jgi:ribosome-associated protein